MAGQPAPYPQSDRGVTIRGLPFPTDTPDPEPDRPPAERRDGSVCSLRATLGIGPPAATAPDDRVHDWSDELGHPTVRSLTRGVR